MFFRVLWHFGFLQSSSSKSGKIFTWIFGITFWKVHTTLMMLWRIPKCYKDSLSSLIVWLMPIIYIIQLMYQVLVIFCPCKSKSNGVTLKPLLLYLTISENMAKKIVLSSFKARILKKSSGRHQESFNRICKCHVRITNFFCFQFFQREITLGVRRIWMYASKFLPK